AYGASDYFEPAVGKAERKAGRFAETTARAVNIPAQTTKTIRAPTNRLRARLQAITKSLLPCSRPNQSLDLPRAVHRARVAQASASGARGPVLFQERFRAKRRSEVLQHVEVRPIVTRCRVEVAGCDQVVDDLPDVRGGTDPPSSEN